MQITSIACMEEKIHELRLAAHATALRGCSMFADVPADDLKKIARIALPRRTERGEYLFREGDPARGFFIVRKGAVSIHRIGADGGEKVIHVFRQGTSFAEGTLGNEANYPAGARAVEESELLFIPRTEFLALLRADADIALRIIGSMSQHLRLLVNALEDLQGKDVETRLMNWLLKRCPHPLATSPVEIALDVTKSVLASELSTRNETLSRALAKLRDIGQIEVEGKVIRILSPQKLDSQFRINLGEGV
jgi:CRP-like cAMP-binding protein